MRINAPHFRRARRKSTTILFKIRFAKKVSYYLLNLYPKICVKEKLFTLAQKSVSFRFLITVRLSGKGGLPGYAILRPAITQAGFYATPSRDSNPVPFD